MKFNLIIEESEKKRILSLHEQEKQDAIYAQTTFPKQKLGDTFEYGKFESNTTKQFITNLKPQIEEFMKNSGKNSFVVRISAGESQVTNPAQFKEPGSLATARAEQIKKYFEEIFPEQTQSGVLKINIAETKIGTTPYKPGDQNDEEKKKLYKQEQFVDFDIVGEGETRTPLDFCKQGKKDRRGGFIPSRLNFIDVIDWNLGPGEGQFYIYSDSLTMPDILYFEYNGNSYMDESGGNIISFRGEDADWTRLLVGTALLGKFGDGGTLPPQYGNTTYKRIDISGYTDAINNVKSNGWSMKDSFINMYGSGQEFDNPNYMSAFEEFDKDGKVKKLIKSLGNNFSWGYLTSPILKPLQKNIPVVKVDRIDTIKIINVAPNGGTAWNVGTTCQKF